MLNENDNMIIGKGMSDYSKGKIYKIVHNINGSTYIGSTTKTLNSRLRFHLWHYNRYLDDMKAGKSIKGVYTSYQIVSDQDPNNYRIEKIMDYPCNSKKELEDKEYEIILEYGDKCINTYGKQDSKDTRKYYKKYYKDNVQSYKDYYNIVKDKIKEQYQSKKTYIHCKECECEVLNVSMSKHIKSKKHLNACGLYASKLETNENEVFIEC
jgi:hypothetical protein